MLMQWMGIYWFFWKAFASGKYLAHIQYSEKEMFYCILFAENDL